MLHMFRKSNRRMLVIPERVGFYFYVYSKRYRKHRGFWKVSRKILLGFLLCFGVLVLYRIQLSTVQVDLSTKQATHSEFSSQLYKPLDWDKINVTSSAFEERQCTPIHHVVFLKIHKAGSSTLLNLIARFAIKNDLVVALPKDRNYVNRLAFLNTSIFIPPPPGREHNIMCNHAVYNRTVFRSFFPKKMKYLAILREPFYQFLSAFRYYSVYKVVGGPEPIRNFLMHPNKYNFPTGGNFVHNRMIFDLGLSSKYFSDEKMVIDHINMIERDFDLILILEYFEESLVLLRRRFCWEMKDVLYRPLNTHGRAFSYSYTFEDHDLHRNYSKADYMLYRHFLKLFWLRIFEYGPDFFEEVNFFRNVIKRVQLFCSAKHTAEPLNVPGSRWNSPFELSVSDCKLISLSEMRIVHILRKINARQHQTNSSHL